MSSDSARSMPVLGGDVPDGVPHEPEGRDLEVEEVHRHLCAAQLLDPEPVGLDLGQPAARLANPARDPLGKLDVLGREIDVVGDQERTGADRDRPGRRMEARRPEIGFAATLLDLLAQAFVAAASDVRELDAFRSSMAAFA